jgi:hypothetical protein
MHPHHEHRLNLADRLRSLPAVAAQPDGWTDVQRRLGARRAGAERRYYAMRVAAAASVALVAVTALWRIGDLALEQPGRNAALLQPLSAEQAIAADRVAQLQSQSQALDDMLGGLGARPVVERAGTSLPIDTLEAQVQWLDHQLSVGDGELEPRSAEQLWRRRVETMNSLVQLRYVEAQRIDM